MTAAEAEAYVPDEHLRAEVEQLMPNIEQTDPRAHAVEQAKQTIAEALAVAGRFTPTVNKHYADLAHAFIRTQAERNNLDAAGIAAMVPHVVSMLGEGMQTLDQSPETARGAFEPSSKTIALLEHADLSTFLHESGHWFLHATMENAAHPNAPADVKADAQILLDSYGVKDVETWRAMTLDEQRQHHETFARGFERYLREGKAPTAELQTMFSRFRSWLLSVYK